MRSCNSRFIAGLDQPRVTLDSKIVPKYSNEYLKEEPTEMLTIKTKDSEVLILPAKEHHVVSFANGVFTSKGGTHVDNFA